MSYRERRADPLLEQVYALQGVSRSTGRFGLDGIMDWQVFGAPAVAKESRSTEEGRFVDYARRAREAVDRGQSDVAADAYDRTVEAYGALNADEQSQWADTLEWTRSVVAGDAGTAEANRVSREHVASATLERDAALRRAQYDSSLGGAIDNTRKELKWPEIPWGWIAAGVGALVLGPPLVGKLLGKK